jgi:DNA-binding Lrp family transcriptional regulator
MELTERDREIIRLVHRHRFLRSSHIVSLLGKNSQQLLRRLRLLYHHGYLERPRCQLDYYHQGGSRPIVYGLGNKGGSLLRQELGAAFRPLAWGEKNRAVGRIFLEHALLVSDVMVALELACREAGQVRLLTPDEIAPIRCGKAHRRPFQWKVKLPGGLKLGVVPDRVFALEFPGEDGGTERAYFFLEADRGTMPVKRRSLTQSSFYRKLLAYEATWSQSLHRRRFGFHRFRVLTVTSSTDRVKSLVEACGELRSGHGLFLFADQSVLKHPYFLFTPLWRSGRDEPTRLLP